MDLTIVLFIIGICVLGFLQLKGYMNLNAKDVLYILGGIMAGWFLFFKRDKHEILSKHENERRELREEIQQIDKDIEKDKKKIDVLDQKGEDVKADLESELTKASEIKPEEVTQDEAESYLRNFINDVRNSK